MLAQERYQKILDILEKESSVKVTALTKLFDVSIETVRRDLEYLEKDGYLKRVYGGAVLENFNKKRMTFQSRTGEAVQEKSEIANIAAGFVSEDQSIALDSSTTNLEIVKVLKEKFQKLTIITNSLMIANELSDMSKYTIILTGGLLKHDELSFVGSMAQENLKGFNVDIAFISASGVSLKEGITDCQFDELQIQRNMINISQQVIILADSSKFDSVSLMKICDFDKVNMIITDSKLKENILEKYHKNGIEVVNR